jgi:AraC-like DNA-binding protein
MTFTEVMLYDFATRVSNRRRTHSYSKMVNDCCSFIDEHVRERLRVSQVAASIGFNADYASKRFKGETGRSIGEYVKEAKISEARSLLKYSELSIAEISELLSFSSQSFFTSVFRQVTGVTPGQYREKARQ